MKAKTIITVLFIMLCFSGFSQKFQGVVIKTSLGNITCEIDTVHAPVTAHNFLNHIKLNVI